MTKVVPLATWTRDQVWDYLRAQGIRHHPLYDRGYMSIGCEPCTRATQPGEQERAGRWWWESDTHKECLLHPPIELRELAGVSRQEKEPVRRGAV
jgi:phosphoadenosine phosphosulfate reductase